MKLRYYMPYWFTWLASKTVRSIIRVPQSGSNWVKYFGGGYNKTSFMSFVVGMRKEDPKTYWIMLIAPNGLCISLILLIFAVTKLIR